MNGRAVNRRRPCGIVRALAGAFALLTAGIALAVPYRPANDEAVIERVPARSALEQLAPLRVAVAQRPQVLEPALELARSYIEIGRRESDPRFVAYAESTLAPWLARPQPPEPVLVLQAIALQYLHQFDASLLLLDRALKRQPLDGQAWLVRAGLLELRGDFAESRRACARLIRTTDEITSLVCLTSVQSRSGELAPSYAMLNRVSGNYPQLAAGMRSWLLAVRADMAERLGDDPAAEANLRAALVVSPADPYLRATYADLLIRLDRPAEVLTLLAGCEAQDPLLLRLAIAARRVGAPDAPRWAELYEERVRATMRGNDVTHKREEALFLLDVQDNPPAALAAAAANWAVQREPVDLRIYARAAVRAHSSRDQVAIAAWIKASGYQDRVLEASARAAGAGP